MTWANRAADAADGACGLPRPGTAAPAQYPNFTASGHVADVGAMTTLQRAEAAERAMGEELDRVVVKSVLFTLGEQDPTKPAPRSPDQGKIILACLLHDHRPYDVPVAGRQ